MRIRAAVALPIAVGLIVAIAATPALACGGLVAPNGTVRLLRTSTLAAYHDGVEHYVTSFQFAGDGAVGEFGSIVPLPAVPTSVERGGDWTLQRLSRETTPQLEFASAAGATAAAAPAPAEVLQQTRIDALDLTVLKGGGQAVGDWARAHGFLLTPDAPELLDYYARQSPIFLAARFDAAAARARGQGAGDGTPIHITMPMDHPWVPLRILTLGRQPFEPVQADVFLLTDSQPSLRPGFGHGMTLDYSQPATDQLLQDLRGDKGMAWVPPSSWLSLVRIAGSAQQLTYDLSIDGGHPVAPAVKVTAPRAVIHGSGGSLAWLWVVAGLLALVAVGMVAAAWATASGRARPAA